MNLVQAIKANKNLQEIKKLVHEKGIPVDSKWIDYKALNLSIAMKKIKLANFLLQNNCRVNMFDTANSKPSMTPLHNAVLLDNYELVIRLLRKNASITAVNFYGHSPLHFAFILGYKKITDEMLDYIEKTATFVNIKSPHGLTYFHIACARSKESLILSYLKTDKSSLNDSVKKDSPYYAEFTVLQFAILSKSLSTLQLLLERGGSLFSNQVESKLALAQQNLQHAALEVYLLSSYAQTKEISQFHIACMQQNPDFVKAFLECGVPVNTPVDKEAASFPLYTPLHFAVEANCLESVKILLQHGANAHLKNAKFMTPLHFAFYNDNQQVLDLLYTGTKKKKCTANLSDCYRLQYFHIAVAMNDFELVFKFLHKSQNVNSAVLPNSPNFPGYTPLHFAVRYGHLEMTKLLMKNAANVNASNTRDGTPLHVASSAGHNDIVTLLLEHQSSVHHLRPWDNKTVLHLLIEKHVHTETRNNPLVIALVKQLIYDFGLDVNAQDRYGNTALHYACTSISVGAPCAQVLIECGADINIVNAAGVTPFMASLSGGSLNDLADYLWLYAHIQKLSELGLNVNPQNHKCCAELITQRKNFLMQAGCFKNRSLKQRKDKRAAELKKMKATNLWPDVSVHDFTVKNSLGLYALATNARLTSITKIKSLKKEFPQFAYFIDLQRRKLESLYNSQ